MAYFHYESKTDNDCLLTSFRGLLENAGLLVSDEFSSDVQVFAESQSGEINYKSKVKVFISWVDKRVRTCSVEVRSDEPLMKRDTSCEKVVNDLRALIPPKDISTLIKKEEQVNDPLFDLSDPPE
tara:strand:- start:53 stop:427 length:375 start_codon:yes stop_codon:yes gene_type:complete